MSEPRSLGREAEELRKSLCGRSATVATRPTRRRQVPALSKDAVEVPPSLSLSLSLSHSLSNAEPFRSCKQSSGSHGTEVPRIRRLKTTDPSKNYKYPLPPPPPNTSPLKSSQHKNTSRTHQQLPWPQDAHGYGRAPEGSSKTKAEELRMPQSHGIRGCRARQDLGLYRPFHCFFFFFFWGGGGGANLLLQENEKVHPL